MRCLSAALVAKSRAPGWHSFAFQRGEDVMLCRLHSCRRHRASVPFKVPEPSFFSFRIFRSFGV
jgi:hypothetical protein